MKPVSSLICLLTMLCSPVMAGAETLAESIAAQIDDPASGNAMAVRAREIFNEQFTTDRMVRSTEALYEEFAIR